MGDDGGWGPESAVLVGVLLLLGGSLGVVLHEVRCTAVQVGGTCLLSPGSVGELLMLVGAGLLFVGSVRF